MMGRKNAIVYDRLTDGFFTEQNRHYNGFFDFWDDFEEDGYTHCDTECYVVKAHCHVAGRGSEQEILLIMAVNIDDALTVARKHLSKMWNTSMVGGKEAYCAIDSVDFIANGFLISEKAHPGNPPDNDTG